MVWKGEVVVCCVDIDAGYDLAQITCGDGSLGLPFGAGAGGIDDGGEAEENGHCYKEFKDSEGPAVARFRRLSVLRMEGQG